MQVPNTNYFVPAYHQLTYTVHNLSRPYLEKV